MKTTVELATAASIKVEHAKQTHDLVVASIKHQQEALRSMEHMADNPQVKSTIDRIQAYVDILESVKSSLEGKHAYLRIYTH